MSVFRRRGHRKDANETVCRLSRLYALGPSHFFFRLASNAFRDIGSVGRIEKKKPSKQHYKKSQNRRP